MNWKITIELRYDASDIKYAIAMAASFLETLQHVHNANVSSIKIEWEQS